MSEQLELFADEPFSLRIRVDEAVRIFTVNYWCHLPSHAATKAHFRRILAFFHGHFLDTISKADVERFRRHLKEMGYSEPTINKSHMILSRIFRKFEEYREGGFLNGADFRRLILPEKNPAAQVPKVSEKRYARKTVITKDDIRKLISYSDENLAEIIKTLYWTMLRPSDLKRLTTANVDAKNMVLVGIQNKTITSRNPSGVPFRVAMTLEVAEIIKRRGGTVKPGTPLFHFGAVRFRWQRVRVLAGMPWVQLRDLRRSAATFLLDNGTDAQTVAEGLGHTTLRMLPSYTPRSEKHLKEAVLKLSEI